MFDDFTYSMCPRGLRITDKHVPVEEIETPQRAKKARHLVPIKPTDSSLTVYRKQRGVQRIELAQQIGINVQTLDNIERGKQVRVPAWLRAKTFFGATLEIEPFVNGRESTRSYRAYLTLIAQGVEDDVAAQRVLDALDPRRRVA